MAIRRIETRKQRTNRVPRRRRPREVEDALVGPGPMAEHVLEDGRRVAAPAELGRDGAGRLEGVGLVPRLWRHNHHIAGELQRRAEAPLYLHRWRKVLRSRFGLDEVSTIFKVCRVGPVAFLNAIQVDVALRAGAIVPKGLARQFVGLELIFVDVEQEPPDPSPPGKDVPVQSWGSRCKGERAPRPPQHKRRGRLSAGNASSRLLPIKCARAGRRSRCRASRLQRSSNKKWRLLVRRRQPS